MATHGSRRLLDMAANAAAVVGVELLSAAQGLDFHRPLQSSAVLEEAHTVVRTFAEHWATDRYIAPELPAASERSDEHTSELQSLIRTSYAVFCLKKKKT